MLHTILHIKLYLDINLNIAIKILLQYGIKNTSKYYIQIFFSIQSCEICSESYDADGFYKPVKCLMSFVFQMCPFHLLIKIGIIF